MDLGGLGVDGDYEEIPDTQGMDDEDKGGFLNDDVVNKLVDSTLEQPHVIEHKPKQSTKHIDPIDDLDLLNLNDEEIDNIPVRIFIVLDPEDDNHKNINLKEIF